MGVQTPNLDIATGPLAEILGNEEVSPGVRRTRRRPVASVATDIASLIVARFMGGLLWKFDSSTTTAADPGSGDIRFNNASFASVTELSISDLNALTGNPNSAAWVLSWDDSGSPPYGTLYIKKAGAEQNYAIFNVTNINDQTGYTRVSVAYVNHAGTFGNGDTLSVLFVNGGQAAVGPTRIKLAAPTEFYVATTGNDVTGNGSVGNPWATCQGAYDTLFRAYDFAGMPVTVNVADGTYTKGLTAFGRIVGQRQFHDLFFKGNLANRANVIIRPAAPPADYYCFGAAFGAMYKFEGFTLDMSNGAQDTVNAGSQTILGFQNVTFGDSINPWTDFISYDGGTIYVLGDYEITKTLTVKQANRTNGSPTLTSVSNFTGIKKFQGIGGTGIALDCFVSDFNVGAGTITMSKNATSTGTAGDVSFHMGGVCHYTSGRNGVIAFLTDGQPGIVDVQLNGSPYYLQAFQFVNGGKTDSQAVGWSGPALGKPVWVRAGGIADNFMEGVGGDYPPGNEVYLNAASFSLGDETITLGTTTGVTVGRFVNGFVTLNATRVNGSQIISVASLSMIEGGCKVSGVGIPPGAQVIGISGSGPFNLTLSYPATSSGTNSIKVTGAGIKNGTYVRKLVGSVISLSQPAVSTQSGVQLAFAGLQESGGQVV